MDTVNIILLTLNKYFCTAVIFNENAIMYFFSCVGVALPLYTCNSVYGGVTLRLVSCAGVAFSQGVSTHVILFMEELLSPLLQYDLLLFIGSAKCSSRESVSWTWISELEKIPTTDLRK